MGAAAARHSQYWSLAGMLVVTLLVGAVGSYVTAPAIPTWYAGLVRPSIAPPNWVFGPVWTTLFLMMAVAAWLVWRLPPSSKRRTALVLFALQLGLNMAWSLLFFGLGRIELALIEVVVLLTAIVATAVAYAGLSRPAALLMLPYIAWVSFAAVLNFEFWRLNG